MIYARKCDLLNIGINQGYYIDGKTYSTKEIANLIVKFLGYKNWEDAVKSDPVIFNYTKWNPEQEFYDTDGHYACYLSDGTEIKVSYL